MFKLISKAVDGMFEQSQPQQMSVASSPQMEAKAGMDLLQQLLIEYGYGGNYWSEANYPAYSFQGYSKNPIVNHCIAQISDACAGIDILISRNGTQIENVNDDLVKLLKRPNPLTSFSTFVKYSIAYMMISGNCYTWANTSGGTRKKIYEMHALRPDRVQVIPNSFSLPLEYIYTINGKSTTFPCDPLTFESEILQVKYFHPLNDLYGLSPVQVALMGIDQHNEANEWNMNLLNNAGRPSGLVSIDSKSPMSETQRQDIVLKIQQRITGTKNAGVPVVSSADLKWQSTGLTPAEMDWIESKSAISREICLAFKYPPYLLGLKDGATFNNMAEAKMSFYEETVIPMMKNFLDELGYYLTRILKVNIEITIDKDRITALAPRRESARNNAINAFNGGLISLNEARAEMDYDPFKNAPQADVPMVPAGKLPINFDASDLVNSQNPDEEEEPEEDDSNDS